MCILDTEASPEHLSRGTARYADGMLVVVEPYYWMRSEGLAEAPTSAELARFLAVCPRTP